MAPQWEDICISNANELRAHAHMLMRLARMTSLQPERVAGSWLMRDAKQSLRVARAWIFALRGERARRAYQSHYVALLVTPARGSA